MAVNKYGNDFKNNIMWNKEYPFIPEVTNDYGFTIHEGDIVDYYNKEKNKLIPYRVAKIYNKDFVWCRYDLPRTTKWQGDYILKANQLLPYTSNAKPPRIFDYDNQEISNYLQEFLSYVYASIYDDELSLLNDWHFDKDKYNAKRLEEVKKLKSKY